MINCANFHKIFRQFFVLPDKFSILGLNFLIST